MYLFLASNSALCASHRVRVEIFLNFADVSKKGGAGVTYVRGAVLSDAPIIRVRE